MLHDCTHLATVDVKGLPKLNVTTNKNNTNNWTIIQENHTKMQLYSLA